MTIRNKLLCALSMVLVVVTVITLTACLTINGNNQLKLEVVRFQKAKQELALAKDLQMEISKVWQFITDASLTKDHKVIIEEAKPAFEKALHLTEQLKNSASVSDEQRARLKNALLEMYKTGEDMFAAYQNDWNRGNQVMDLFDKAADATITSVEQIVGAADNQTLQAETAMNTKLAQQQRATISTSVLSLTVSLLLVALMLVLVRSITRALAALNQALEEVAQGDGDLSKRLDDNGKDEISLASHWFNLFMTKLSGVVNQVAQDAAKVATEATQLKKTATHLATSTEEVGAQASTVAAASAEMAVTSDEIARNCIAAAESAQQAAKNTRNGFELVTRTVNGIRERGERTRENAHTIALLGERSDQIGAIVSTIEDIADQTNLLALNAAIEAARAGEMGRGFSVVADEVRALAERTTRATKEISEMIRAIQQETKQAIISMDEGVRGTEQGAREAAQLEHALQTILEQVSTVTEQVSQIATAAEQQTTVTGEITNNIQTISEVIENASKDTQEASAAASDLNKVSAELTLAMSQFKLG